MTRGRLLGAVTLAAVLFAAGCNSAKRKSSGAAATSEGAAPAPRAQPTEIRSSQYRITDVSMSTGQGAEGVQTR